VLAEPHAIDPFILAPFVRPCIIVCLLSPRDSSVRSREQRIGRCELFDVAVTSVGALVSEAAV
jgi:hypothetical protein